MFKPHTDFQEGEKEPLGKGIIHVDMSVTFNHTASSQQDWFFRL